MTDPTTKRCDGVNGCGHRKPLDAFEARRDNETEEIVGYRGLCRDCDRKQWEAKRDGKAIVKVTTDEYGNELPLTKSGRGDMTRAAKPRLFTEDRQADALAQIRRSSSIQACADHIEVNKGTLERWLREDREPYASWARLFRLAWDSSHRDRHIANLEAAADDGDVRAAIFLAKHTASDPEEFADKKSLDMTVRRGADEIDPESFTVEELLEYRRLVEKGSDGGEDE